MDDIKKRLEDTSKACLEAYEVWNAKKDDADLRETLQEAIHDLRKVGSRLEIEIAVSERNNMTSKPLPIPPHRSSSKSKGPIESILPDDGNTVGNSSHNNNGGGRKDGGARKSRGRRPAPRRQAD